MNGVVFDTGALIALERGDRGVTVLIIEARRTTTRLTVPAGCVAQAWRHPATQARLAMFLRLPIVEVPTIDAAEARRIGLLLAATQTSDIVDAHVALCAQRLGQTVLTSDPNDIALLGPSLEIHRV